MLAVDEEEEEGMGLADEDRMRREEEEFGPAELELLPPPRWGRMTMGYWLGLKGRGQALQNGMGAITPGIE